MNIYHIVWLTEGSYELNAIVIEETEEKAIKELCPYGSITEVEIIGTSTTSKVGVIARESL